jgi:hypothetical protein
MLEIIIWDSLEIIDGIERFIDKARRLIGSGSLDDADAYTIHGEIESLTDVALVMDEATRLLRRTLERWPEIARPYRVHATLQ